MSHDKEKLYWLAKRLKDVAEDMEKLSEKDKRFVIERVDRVNPVVLKELCDALNEYM